MSDARLSPWAKVLQSQAIHPDWTPEQHLEFLISEGYATFADSATIIASWLADNIAKGRVEAIVASATRAEPDPFWGEIIHAYTRAQAIEDGTLHDVTALAKEAGFTIPVALTAAAWFGCVEWTRDDEHAPPQDETGRLWDVLNMAWHCALRNRDNNRAVFSVLAVPNTGRARNARRVRLVLDVGPGDAGEPVATIGYPEDF